MALTNATGYKFIDIARTVVESELIGKTDIAMLGIVFFAILALMIIGARREAVFLIPIPVMISFVEIGGIPVWWKVIIAIVTMLFFSLVVRNIITK